MEISAAYWSGKCLIELFHYAEVYVPLAESKILVIRKAIFFPPFKEMALRRSNIQCESMCHCELGSSPYLLALIWAQGLGCLPFAFPEYPASLNQKQSGSDPSLCGVSCALVLTLGNLSGSPGCLGITFCNLWKP